MEFNAEAIIILKRAEEIERLSPQPDKKMYEYCSRVKCAQFSLSLKPRSRKLLSIFGSAFFQIGKVHIS